MPDSDLMGEGLTASRGGKPPHLSRAVFARRGKGEDDPKNPQAALHALQIAQWGFRWRGKAIRKKMEKSIVGPRGIRKETRLEISISSLKLQGGYRRFLEEHIATKTRGKKATAHDKSNRRLRSGSTKIKGVSIGRRPSGGAENRSEPTQPGISAAIKFRCVTSVEEHG